MEAANLLRRFVVVEDLKVALPEVGDALPCLSVTVKTTLTSVSLDSESWGSAHRLEVPVGRLLILCSGTRLRGSCRLGLVVARLLRALWDRRRLRR